MNTVADLKEVVELGAAHGPLFYRTFFPKTCRMGFADCHIEVSDLLDNPHARLVNIRIARGWAKTSLLRMYMGRRVAYGLSRTILYIGASEGHAARSVRWLKAQVERNTLFAQTFQLRKGSKWDDTTCEILHGVEGTSIWLIGVGITGSVRGINFEDFRPDLIILDDVLTDENVKTDDQREKIINLVLGAVKESLAPETENPDAKMVMLQTPLDKKDASSEALKDPAWSSMVAPCWTPVTIDLPLSLRKSSWEERYPTPTLIKEATSAILMNRYSIFAREKECRLITSETAAFRVAKLKYWDAEGMPPLSHGMVNIAIDPVPPPSEIQLAKNLVGKDFESISVQMRLDGKYYLLAYEKNRGHEPLWTAQTVLRFVKLFQPYKILAESIAYQRVLAGTLRNYLIRNQVYTPVVPITDTRNKYMRITGALQEVAGADLLYCSKDHLDFISDFEMYPNVEFDDLLDSVSMGIADLVNPFLEGKDSNGGFFAPKPDEYNRPLKIQRGVP